MKEYHKICLQQEWLEDGDSQALDKKKLRTIARKRCLES